MESMKNIYSITRYAFFCGILLFPFTKKVEAQYYYVNSYALSDSLGTLNSMYRIDLEAKTVIDSLFVYNKGEYLNKIPFQVDSHGNHLLINFMISGIAGKNTQLGETFCTLYSIIDQTRFELIIEDSLLNTYTYPDISVRNNLLKLEWLDDSPSSRGHYRGNYSLRRNDYRLHLNNRGEIGEDNDSLLVIGPYANPTLFHSSQNSRYYWVMFAGAHVTILRTDIHNNILQEFVAGDKTISSVLIGYNDIDNNIYIITLRYNLLSYSPPVISPDSIYDKITIIDPSNFSELDNISLDSEPFVISNEIGTLDFINQLFVYYYFESEDYRSFQPAYLLIFDTRTNEATWLRVGWR